jgi:hypothetical protein
VDRKTRKFKEVGDFPTYYLEGTVLPRPTLFIPGAHEDHVWLKERFKRGRLNILPNLTLLINGYKTTIGTDEDTVTVVGLGKTYSQNFYGPPKVGDKPFLTLKEMVRRQKHYTRAEVNRATTHGPTDILLTHQAGQGSRLGHIQSECLGINKISFAIRPKIHFHGGYNTSKEYTAPQTKTRTVSLAREEIALYEFQAGRFERIL